MSDDLRLLREAVQSIARTLRDSRDAREAFYTTLDLAGSPSYPRTEYDTPFYLPPDSRGGYVPRVTAAQPDPREPQPCSHSAVSIGNLYGPGPTSADPLSFVGQYLFCHSCGAVRKRDEPFSREPDGEVPREVADGR